MHLPKSKAVRLAVVPVLQGTNALAEQLFPRSALSAATALLAAQRQHRALRDATAVQSIFRATRSALCARQDQHACLALKRTRPACRARSAPLMALRNAMHAPLITTSTSQAKCCASLVQVSAHAQSVSTAQDAVAAQRAAALHAPPRRAATSHRMAGGQTIAG